jgi:hypothetical protein
VQNTKKLGELLPQLLISTNYASVIKRAGNKMALRVKKNAATNELNCLLPHLN